MFSRMILSVAFLSTLALAPAAYAGKVDLTTYYPAPYGEYRQIKVTGADMNNGNIALEAKGSSTTSTGLVVTNANQVGIGITSPNQPLEVAGNIGMVSSGPVYRYVFTPGTDQWLRLYDGYGNYTRFAASDLYASNSIYCVGGISANGGISASGSMSASSLSVTNGITANSVTASSFTYSSDIRLKENIIPVASPLEKIGRLEGVNFNFKSQPGEKRLGLLAQNVESVVPEVVRTQADGMKGVDYASLTALLIEGMKEQQKEINALREELGRVKAAAASGR